METGDPGVLGALAAQPAAPEFRAGTGTATPRLLPSEVSTVLDLVTNVRRVTTQHALSVSHFCTLKNCECVPKSIGLEHRHLRKAV